MAAGGNKPETVSSVGIILSCQVFSKHKPFVTYTRVMENTS